MIRAGVIYVCSDLSLPKTLPAAETLMFLVIGSIRRECFNHVIVLNARHWRRTLSSYFAYYHGARTHLSLGKDTPNRSR